MKSVSRNENCIGCEGCVKHSKQLRFSPPVDSPSVGLNVLTMRRPVWTILVSQVCKEPFILVIEEQYGLGTGRRQIGFSVPGKSVPLSVEDFLYIQAANCLSGMAGSMNRSYATSPFFLLSSLRSQTLWGICISQS